MKKTSLLAACAAVALLGFSTSAKAQFYYPSVGVTPYVVTPGFYSTRAAGYGPYYGRGVTYVQPTVAAYSYAPTVSYEVASPYVVTSPYVVGSSYGYVNPGYSVGYPYTTRYAGNYGSPVYVNSGRGLFYRR